MASTNTVIKIRSSGVPGNTPATLDFGELALNYRDGKIFYKDHTNSIVPFSVASNTNSFATINSNNSLILASSSTDILSLVPGNNITFNTDTLNKSITINSYDFYVRSTANNASANTVVTQGVDNTQNTNITYATGVSQGAFDKANTVQDNLNGANSRISIIENIDLTQNNQIQAAFNRANSGASQANTAQLLAQASYNQANVTVGVDATQNASITIIQGVDATQNLSIQAAYNQSNTIQLLAQAGYNQANVTVGVDATQNASITIIQSTDLTQNLSIQAAYNQANVTVGVDATQNASIIIIQGVDNTQNNRLTINEAVDLTQNLSIAAAYAQANVTVGVDATQNNRITINEGVDATQNLSISASYNQANTAQLLAQAGYNQANVTVGVDATQNASIVVIQGIDATQNLSISSAYFQANTAQLLSQASYNQANVTVGVDATQNLAITTAFFRANTGHSFVESGGTISGNVNISGDLQVTGNITSVGGNVINVLIKGNTGQFFGNTSTGFGALYAGIGSGFTIQPQTVFQSTANFNEYAQINIQNISPGGNASSDVVATADNGTANDTYIDMGINSSTYDSPKYSITGPNDGYLYVSGNTVTGGGNLILGTDSNKDIIFSLGGMTSSNEYARFSYTSGLKLKNLPLTFADGTSQNTSAAPFSRTNASFNQANTANILAQAAYNQANVTIGVDTTQNTSITIIQGVDLTQNLAIQAAFDKANIASGFDQFARDTANTAAANTIVIRGVDLTQNLAIQAAFDKANSSSSTGIDQFARDTANTASSNTIVIQGVDNTQNNRIQDVYNRANSKTYTFYQNTAPATANNIGDIWIHSDTGEVFENFGNISNPVWAETGPTVTGNSTGIDQFARDTANTASSNTIVIQGVDLTQNLAIQAAFDKANSSSNISLPITEIVFTITDSPGFQINPSNGTIQLIILTANRTPVANNFLNGQSVTLMVDDGTNANTLTWTDSSWGRTRFGTNGVSWIGNSAPSLSANGYTVIEFWKASGNVFGALVGTTP